MKKIIKNFLFIFVLSNFLLFNSFAYKDLPPAGYEDEVITNIEDYNNPFPDTNTTNIEGKAAAELYRRSVIGGFPDGEFKGNNNVNRAEAAKFLLLARYGEIYDIEGNKEFPDVVKTEWYAKYVLTAANKKIINGYQNGYFGPADFVTAEQFAKMLSLTFDISVENGDTDPWSLKYYNALTKYNLKFLNFNRSKNLSRNDVAVAIYQYLANNKSSSTNSSNTESSNSSSADTNSSNTESSNSSAADTNSSDTESLSSDSTETDSSDTESSNSDSTEADSSDTESSNSDSTETDSSDTESSSSDSTETNSSDTESENSDAPVEQAKITISRYPNSLGDTEYSSNTNNVVFMAALIDTEKDISIKEMKINLSDTQNIESLNELNNKLTNIKILLNENVITILDNFSGTSLNDAYLDISDSFDVETAKTNILKIVGDFNAIEHDDGFKLSLPNDGLVSVEYKDSGNNVPQENIEGSANGSFVLVYNSIIQISRTDTIPNGEEIPDGTTDTTVMKFSISNNNAGDVEIEQITIQADKNETTTDFSKITIGIMIDGIVWNYFSPLDSTGKRTFDDLSLIIPNEGEKKEIEIIADLGTGTVGGSEFSSVKFLIQEIGATNRENGDEPQIINLPLEGAQFTITD